MTSPNGWTVHTTATGLEPLDWITGRVLPGDVHRIFDYLCARFHAEVEPIRKDWSWGWANRLVRGSSTTTSKHAYAIAIDLNAPRHPMGKRFTFTWRQRRAIRRILKELRGVVQWGGGWRRPDDMHFEIVGTPAQVAAVVRDVLEPLEVIAYNLKAHRGNAAGRDVAAIIDAERPHVLHLFETAGNRRAVRRVTRAQYRRPITGRGNDGGSTWLLVRKDVPVRRTALLVSRRVWRGPKGGRRIGRTLPMAAITYRGRRVLDVAVHDVWNQTRQAGGNAAAHEQVHTRLEHVGRVNRGALTLSGDWNRPAAAKGEGTPRDLAATIGAKVIETGAHVDYALVRGLEAKGITLGRLKGGSDHVPVRIRHTIPTPKETP